MLQQKIEKLSRTIEEQIQDYGLSRYGRILSNEANNVSNNIKKENLEKALGHLFVLSVLCDIGISQVTKRWKAK